MDFRVMPANRVIWSLLRAMSEIVSGRYLYDLTSLSLEALESEDVPFSDIQMGAVVPTEIMNPTVEIA